MTTDVYWRRRAIALGALVCVLAIGIWGVVALVGVSDSPPPAPPAPRPAAAPAKPAPPPPPCPDESIRVTVELGQPAYRVGDDVKLISTITNTGEQECVRDIARPLRELVVLDRDGAPVWSSNDCFWESTNEKPVLEPGQPVHHETRWRGHTSTNDCLAPRKQLPPGDFNVVAKLGEIASAPTHLTLI